MPQQELDAVFVVFEASVMPCMPAGNTDAPTLAIAEAADLLRQPNGQRL